MLTIVHVAIIALMLAQSSERSQDFASGWWRWMAEQGDARAQANQGVMYTTGKSVPQDYAEAVKWYRLAAEQGNAEAQANLTYCKKQDKLR